MVGGLGEPAGMNLTPDGRYIVDWKMGGAMSRAEWRIEDGRFCLTFSDGSGSCEEYRIDGDYLTFVSYGMSLDDSDNIWIRVRE